MIEFDVTLKYIDLGGHYKPEQVLVKRVYMPDTAHEIDHYIGVFHIDDLDITDDPVISGLLKNGESVPVTISINLNKMALDGVQETLVEELSS